MTYAVIIFPRPRVLKLLELTDNRSGAEYMHAFAASQVALVRLGDPPAVLKVSSGIKTAELIGDARFWAAVEKAVRLHQRRRVTSPAPTGSAA